MNLNQMRNLPPSWSIEEHIAPPNDTAIVNANRIIEAINRKPFETSPSIEGGVFIRFNNGSFSAIIECYNDGEIGYTLMSYGTSISSRDLKDENIDPLLFIVEIQNHLGVDLERKAESKIG